MRVLQVIDGLLEEKVNGISMHHHYLCKYLAHYCDLTTLNVYKVPHDVINPVVIEKRGNHRIITLNCNVHDIQLPNNSLRSFIRSSYFGTQHWDMIKELIEKEEFDIIHFQDFFASFLIEIIKPVSNLTIVSTIHAVDPVAEQYSEAMRYYLAQNSKKIISVSNWETKEIQKRFHVKSDKITTIYNGIELQADLNAILNRHRDKRYITFAARLDYEKGCDLLLRSLERISDFIRGSNIEVIIIGDGVEKENLINLSRELQIDDFCRFVGSKSPAGVREWLRQSSLHIVPSRMEAFGLIAVEALSEGVKTLVSDVGGLIEIVRNDSHLGQTFKSGDIYDLSDSIINVFEREVTEDDVKGELEYLHKKFNWDEIARQTIDFYNDAIGG